MNRIQLSDNEWFTSVPDVVRFVIAPITGYEVFETWEKCKIWQDFRRALVQQKNNEDYLLVFPVKRSEINITVVYTVKSFSFKIIVPKAVPSVQNLPLLIESVEKVKNEFFLTHFEVEAKDGDCLEFIFNELNFRLVPESIPAA